MSASDRRRLLAPPIVLFAILLALFAADRVLAYAIGGLVRQSDYRLSYIYGADRDVDGLILGNSVGNAMATGPQLGDALGCRVLSLALHGMDARTQAAFVDDYLDRHAAPRFAVMELRSVLSSTVQAEAFGTYQIFSGRLSDLIGETGGDALHWSRISHLRALNSPILPIVLQRVVDRDDQDTGASDGRINSAMKIRYRGLPTPTIRPDQLQAFAATARHLARRGTHVVVIAAPLHDVTRERGDWMSPLIRNVRAALGPGITLIDLSASLPGDRVFEDPVHLNKAGRTSLLPMLRDAVGAQSCRATVASGPPMQIDRQVDRARRSSRPEHPEKG